MKITHLFELDLAEDENIYIYNVDVNCSIELDNVEILSIEKSSRVDGYGDCGEFGERAFIRLEVKLIDLNSSGSIDLGIVTYPHLINLREG